MGLIISHFCQWFLHWSVDHRFISGVRLCLKYAGCDVNARDNRGATALHNAIGNRLDKFVFPEALKLLVNHRACNVNAQNSRGMTALMMVAEYVQSDSDEAGGIIKLLMSREDIDTDLMNHDSKTAIQIMLSKNHSRKIEFNHYRSMHETFLSLANKSRPGAESNKHIVAEAVAYYPETVCEVLLQCRFSPDSVLSTSPVKNEIDASFGIRQSENKETALHCAVRLNSLTKTKLLLDHNADCETKWRGLTPLELAIAYNVRPEILELLSKDMSKSEIAEAIEKCSMVGESVRKCVMRLGVKAWISLFRLYAFNHFDTAHVSSTKLKVDANHRTFAFHSQQVLVEVKRCRTHFRAIESQTISQQVVDLLYAVSDIVAETVPDLRFEPILAGSMAEETKVYLPDEVDVMCVLSTGLEVQDSIDSYTLKLFPDNNLPRCIIDDHKANSVDPDSLAYLFYSAIEIALNKLEIDSSGRIRLFQRSLIWCDKVARLQLMWNGEEFKNMMVSVDLAVCVPVGKAVWEPPVPREIAEQFHLDDYFVINKLLPYITNETGMSSCYYPQLSTSNLEKEILNRLPMNVKRGLILAKAVRIVSIAKPDEDLSTAFCLAEDVHIDDLISSHMLKSCLMFVCRCVEKIEPLQMNQEKFIFTNISQINLKPSAISCRINARLTPHEVACGIYQNLKIQLEQKIVYSWSSLDQLRGMLLNCVNCAYEHSCCMKRKLMLAMTCKILKWLQDNEAQLQDIDYADDTDLGMG